MSQLNSLILTVYEVQRLLFGSIRMRTNALEFFKNKRLHMRGCQGFQVVRNGVMREGEGHCFGPMSRGTLKLEQVS